MSVKVEKLDEGMAKLTVEVSEETLKKAIDQAYLKNKSRINVPGFRKGKAPRRVIEQIYGKGIFYDDAANEVIYEEYPKAVEESKEEIVSDPELSVEQIEEGKPFIFTAKVALKPPVGLGKYKGIEVSKPETEVKDEDVDAEIEKQRNNNARMVDITDRPVQKDDMIHLDYEGFVDGKAFAGGKGEDQPLTIGSGSFIPGFEDQLIGRKIGEDCEVKVTFPADYHEKSLAGKEATFKCHINSIKEKKLPELNDEFASDVSEFDTLEEYKKDLKEKLAKRKEESAKAQKENEAVAALILDSEIELPEAMVTTQARRMLDDFGRQLQMQGLNLQSYLQYTGSSADQMLTQIRPQAIERIKSRLCLEAVAAAEKIEATEEDVENKLKDIASQYHMEVEKLKETMQESDKEQIKKDLAVEKAAQFLVDHAKEVKQKKDKKEAGKGKEASAEEKKEQGAE